MRPRCAVVARRVKRAAFAEDPAAFTAQRENRAHHSRLCVAVLDLDALPCRAAVRSVHQVSARLVLRLEQVDAALADDPTALLVREINIANRIFRRTRQALPRRAAINRFKQRAAAAHSPSMIFAQETDCVQPRHRS